MSWSFGHSVNSNRGQNQPSWLNMNDPIFTKNCILWNKKFLEIKKFLILNRHGFLANEVKAILYRTLSLLQWLKAIRMVATLLDFTDLSVFRNLIRILLKCRFWKPIRKIIFINITSTYILQSIFIQPNLKPRLTNKSSEVQSQFRSSLVLLY